MRLTRAGRKRIAGWLFVAAFFVVLGAILLANPADAKAAAGDIGYVGPSTTGAGSAPTGSKPESKLWWNDGFWWASMWDSASSDFHIFKLDVGTQKWSDTGVALDDRASTRADVLWDAAAGKLYVASHRFSDTAGTGYPSRLYRYSYDAGTDTYSRDPGFPVSINNYKLETLVIAKDSRGELWATWAQGGQIWVNRTLCSPTCDDASWGTPFVISSTSVASDDISSVIAFGGDRVGVMWSDQRAAKFVFALHADGQADNVWSFETALQGPGLADDHINLKTDAAGGVYAAVKTSRSSTTDPLTMLLVRTPEGSWSSHVFGLVRDHHTRPIVEIDETNGVVHMFATSPASNGTIYEKTSPIGSISFSPGLGTPFIKNAAGAVNDSTSTKQNVTSQSGLAVAAWGNDGHYWHNYLSLGGGGPVPPTASFTASPTSGAAPLTVAFTDTSSGSPNSWAWDFDNDGTVDSTAQNPTFVYQTPGTYSVKLEVANSAGSDSLTKANYITVAQPGGGSTVTFRPSDDAYVLLGTPDTNYGSQPTVRTYKIDQTVSYLKFNVAGIAGPVASVKLRLYVTDASDVAGAIYSVANTSWTEGAVTYNTRPAVGSLLRTGSAAPLGTWVEFDLGIPFSGDGVYSFALKDGGSDAVRYSSDEGSNPPQLVVTYGA